jgi:hypothetical protein
MSNGLAWLALCLLTWILSSCAATNADGSKSGDEIQIVAFGTSFTAGQGVARIDAFPAKLEKLLNAEGLKVRIRNEGVSGNTTLNLMARVGSAVPEGTQIVICEYAFGNDRLKGITPWETAGNSEKIISQLVARNIQVLLVIRGADQAQLRRATKLFSGVVAKNGISYIAIEQPKSSILPDGWSHPTLAAHAEIAANMVPQVKSLIERVKAGRR